MDAVGLINACKDINPWIAVACLAIGAMAYLYKAREKDRLEFYLAAISWAEQSAKREDRLTDAIATMAKLVGVDHA